MENFFRFCGFLSDEGVEVVVVVVLVLVPEEAVAVDLTKLGFENLRRNLDERDMVVAAAASSSLLCSVCPSACDYRLRWFFLCFSSLLISAGCSAGEREI